jgi:hypothetical protein
VAVTIGGLYIYFVKNLLLNVHLVYVKLVGYGRKIRIVAELCLRLQNTFYSDMPVLNLIGKFNVPNRNVSLGTVKANINRKFKILLF